MPNYQAFKLHDVIYITDPEFNFNEELGSIISFGTDNEGDVQINYVPDRDLSKGLKHKYPKDSIVYKILPKK